MHSVVNNFPKNFSTAFLKNIPGGTLLISSDYSLNISRAPFNPFMPGGNKGHTYFRKPSTKSSRFV